MQQLFLSDWQLINGIFCSEPKAKPDSEAKREASADTERRSSVHEKSADSGSKADKDGASSATNK